MEEIQDERGDMEEIQEERGDMEETEEETDQRESSCSSSTLDEWHSRRQLAPSLGPLLPYSQTVSAINVEAERTAVSPPSRDVLSLNALDDFSLSGSLSAFSSTAESLELIAHERKLEVLLGLLYEFDDCLEGDETMTTSQRDELQRRLDGVKRLPSAFKRLREGLPRGLEDAYYLRFQEKFQETYEPLICRAERKLNPGVDAPPDEQPRARDVFRPPLETELDLTLFDRFSRSLEELKKRQNTTRGTDENQSAIVSLQDELLQVLIDSMDTRYIDVTKETREKFLK